RVRGQAVCAVLDEPSDAPAIQPPGAENLRRELDPPADFCPFQSRCEIDIRAVIAYRQPGKVTIAEPAIGVHFRDLVTADDTASAEDPDRARSVPLFLTSPFQLEGIDRRP